MKRYCSQLAAIVLFGVSGFSLCSYAAPDPSQYIQMVGPNEVVNSQGKQITQRYGPVRHTDTLWRIASKYRPKSSVSVYQTMVAIFQMNPEAFVDNDLNSLVNGAYLTIPTLEQISAVPEQRAVQIVSKTTNSSPATTKSSISSTASSPKASSSKSTSRVISHVLADQVAKLQKRMDELETMKNKELDVMRKQLDQASEQMLGMSEVNHRLKLRVADLTSQLAAIRDQLDKTRQIQQQILDELKQNKKATGDQTNWYKQLMDSPVNLALAVSIPLLLVLLGLIWLLRLRSKKSQSDTELDEDELSLEEDDDQFSKLFTDDVETSSLDEAPVPEVADEAPLLVDDPLMDTSADEEIAFDDEAISALAEFEDPEPPSVESSEESDDGVFHDLLSEDDDEDVLLPEQESEEPDIDLPNDEELIPDESKDVTVDENDEFSIDFDEPLPSLEESEDAEQSRKDVDALIDQVEQLTSESSAVDESDEQDLNEIEQSLGEKSSLTNHTDELQLDDEEITQSKPPAADKPVDDELSEAQLEQQMAEELASLTNDDVENNFDLSDDEPQSAGPELVTEPDLEPELVTEPDSEPELVTEPDSEPELVTEPDSELELVTEPDSESELVTELDSEPELVTELDSEPELVTEPDSEPELAVEPDSAPELETELSDNEDDDLAALDETPPKFEMEDDDDIDDLGLDFEIADDEGADPEAIEPISAIDEPIDDDLDSLFSGFSEDAFSENDNQVFPDLPQRDEVEDREFVDIDKLMADDDEPSDVNPYTEPKLDVGLDEFASILNRDGPDGMNIDVDADSDGASKLDLARAYLEIDDADGARDILQELLSSPQSDAVQEEAEKILAQLR
ncbi:FimV/HubP family polar landmark protein [Celerinatantimonas yamalensis]|uniref:FimV/HubP family polar landmark protein n=1 Tax=Celerinatantimonas yamalensis TaxID=559956 RepID=A0ABW9G2L1_9GAMM